MNITLTVYIHHSVGFFISITNYMEQIALTS
nr:MAG TPA: hypothetical protein [Caudoviricetes sp.]